jgi:hypothetical protein
MTTFEQEERQEEKAFNERKEKMENRYYPPSNSWELYDPIEEQWYNHSLEELIDPKEYENDYFGDEG